MAIEWKVVRLPASLAARIEDIAAQMMLAHERGMGRLPSDYCERIPPHHVIDRAVTEMEHHRERSRKSRGKKSSSVSTPSPKESDHHEL